MFKIVGNPRLEIAIISVSPRVSKPRYEAKIAVTVLLILVLKYEFLLYTVEYVLFDEISLSVSPRNIIKKKSATQIIILGTISERLAALLSPCSKVLR